MPTSRVPRTEVAAAPFRGDIAVAGGYLADGASTDDVDLYDPSANDWSRLPDLPVEVNHAAAASAGGKLYVAGGYGGPGVRLRSAYVFDGDRWRTLAPMPGVRGAAGAAVVAGKLYVAGGVGPSGLARRAFALDLKTGRWASIPGPTPREHLAVTAAAGKVYAVAGRLAGIDTNLRVFESYSPATKRWTKLAPVPGPRAAGSGLREGAHRLRRRRGAAGHHRLRLRLQPDDEALAPSRRPTDAAPRRRRRDHRRPRPRHRRRHRAGTHRLRC